MHYNSHSRSERISSFDWCPQGRNQSIAYENSILPFAYSFENDVILRMQGRVDVHRPIVGKRLRIGLRGENIQMNIVMIVNYTTLADKMNRLSDFQFTAYRY